MKNFLVGLIVGLLSMYWYLTQMDNTRTALGDMWDRASSGPPPVVKRWP